ncbi:Retrovirus-related Pol polyprotein from transposon TNT 1-94 [Cucumis melo var. makuwa]|uniref:Retrovirus-related Pol polyprotein from transposon TNT 1-94 n=1 Tax=Cucumis melo var. makuwa TaxID=1194695 RepID=A0A5A7V587_CUCMM|nr:Retrovirus-related Pol polyprotein from transposon TNT 1-94 [Cucumis melo var. makuwa]TYK11684.1 Retrovirus-related Pol polyprotein from transposon TNT 1-94 [Cucumis melo var. makuwa]
MKAYRLYDIERKTIFISRDVTFLEQHFPFHSISTNDHSELENAFHDLVLPMPILDTHITTQTNADPIIENPNTDSSPEIQAEQDATNADSTPNTANTEHTTVPYSLPMPCKSTRQHKPPNFLKDYHCHLLAHGSPLKDTTSYHPLNKSLSYEKLNPTHRTFLCNVSTEYEPFFFHQAVKSQSWRNAMDAEIAIMERTNTWSIVPLPHGHHALGCKWVYKVKYHADGTVDKYKARLVTKGYGQQEDIDFLDTFSPVAKIVTVKVLLSLTASFGWSLCQMDVNNAFLNSDLFEEVYMTLPMDYYSKEQQASSTS